MRKRTITRARRATTPRLPTRPDVRRTPNTNVAQRPEATARLKRSRRRPRPPHRGQEAEVIAARRLRALELRKGGQTYRQIARVLHVDVHTAYADVVAEMLDLRTLTAHEAADVRDLEVQRCDTMTEGLWSDVQHGDPKAVMAAVRVSERRAKLLGIDAPQLQNVTLKGDLTVRAKEEYAKFVKAFEDEELAAYLRHQEAMDVIVQTVQARVEAASGRRP